MGKLSDVKPCDLLLPCGLCKPYLVRLTPFYPDYRTAGLIFPYLRHSDKFWAKTEAQWWLSLSRAFRVLAY